MYSAFNLFENYLKFTEIWKYFLKKLISDIKCISIYIHLSNQWRIINTRSMAPPKTTCGFKKSKNIIQKI